MSKRRTKNHDRVQFSKKDKDFILQKSKGCCAHCGTPLSANSMTIDHAVPLSKGGSNDLVNLVALCEECNKGKSADILIPKEYYRYIHKQELSSLQEYFSRYCDSIDWFYQGNIFTSDNIKLSVKYPIQIRGKSQIHWAPTKVNMIKAKYSDLDEIYWFMKEYCRYYKEDSFKVDTLKHDMSHQFEHGCMYYMRNKSGNISMVVSSYPGWLSLNKIDVGVKDNIFAIHMNINIIPGIEFSSSTSKFCKETYMFYYYRDILIEFLSEIGRELCVEDVCIPVSLSGDYVGDERVRLLIKEVASYWGYTVVEGADLNDAGVAAGGYIFYISTPEVRSMLMKNALNLDVDYRHYQEEMGSRYLVHRLLVNNNYKIDKLMKLLTIDLDGTYDLIKDIKENGWRQEYICST